MTIEQHLQIESAALADKWARAEMRIAEENAAAQTLRDVFGNALPVWEVPIKTCSRLFLYEEDANSAAQAAYNADGFRGKDFLGMADYEPKPKWFKVVEKGLPNIEKGRYYPPTIFSENTALLAQAERNNFKSPIPHERI